MPTATSSSPAPATPRAWILAAAALIVGATLLVYANSFSGPFVFDTVPAVMDNPTIHHLWPLGPVLHPPTAHGQTVGGRPLVNFSLAINYAINGNAPPGYHVFNFVVHALAALVLFGVVRRTLNQPLLSPRLGMASLPLAFSVAVLWAVHPLQTESVTYIVQRAESLMGFCYLLTLYAFIRGVGSPASVLWLPLSVLCCLLGMAAKEVMVSAPLIVLLYDRTFVAGTFLAAWRQRRKYYVSLAATWLLLAWLVAGSHHRGGSAGFGTEISWWTYALTQFRAIVVYLKLSLWPAPLVLDYGVDVARTAGEIVPYAVIVLGLAAATLVAVGRKPALGFVGACFFAWLAPSSSIVPVATQTMAEHRMYLPLAAVVGLGVTGLYLWAGRRAWYVVAALAVAFGCVTVRRNDDYRSENAIWTDAVAKRPFNARAHSNLGFTLIPLGRVEEAVAHYRRALELKPDDPELHHNLGNALLTQGHVSEAIVHYEIALRSRPDFAEAHYNLGNALLKTDRLPEAIAHYERALQLAPDLAAAETNLGNALAQRGQAPEAIVHYQRALQLEPDNAGAHASFASALLQTGQFAESVAQSKEALRIKPDLPAGNYNLGNALVQLGRLADAVEPYEQVLRALPDYTGAHVNLGFVLLQLGRAPEAIVHLERALQLSPDDAETHNNLGFALVQVGRESEAVVHFKEALRLRPDYPQARENLERLQPPPHR